MVKAAQSLALFKTVDLSPSSLVNLVFKVPVSLPTFVVSTFISVVLDIFLASLFYYPVANPEPPPLPVSGI